MVRLPVEKRLWKRNANINNCRGKYRKVKIITRKMDKEILPDIQNSAANISTCIVSGFDDMHTICRISGFVCYASPLVQLIGSNKTSPDIIRIHNAGEKRKLLNDKTEIFTAKITVAALKSMAENMFGNLVKAVVIPYLT